MFLSNKYARWYFQIISRAQATVNSSGYFESHHIEPKCLGGRNTKENLVRLTGREHYICHLLLTKMTSGDARKKMLYAFVLMSNHPVRLNGESREFRRVGSRLFQTLREDFRSAVSASRKGKSIFSKTPEATAAKRSAKLKGRVFSEKTKAKMSASAKARSKESRIVDGYSDEVKARMRIAARKREEQKRYLRPSELN